MSKLLKRLFYFLLPLLLGSLPGAAQVKNRAFDTLLRSMLKRSVPTVSVATLASELNKPNAPLLLDTREQAEFSVSHLPKARWIGYETFSIEALNKVPKNQPIVVYCSIGVRSEKIGERLQAAGFTQVRNLYGSIFEWVNQGQEVVDAQGKPTKKVHAYSRRWGVWLQRGEKVY